MSKNSFLQRLGHLFAGNPQPVNTAGGDPGLRARRVFRFELACLRELGLLPSVEHCTHCGEVVEAVGNRFAFGLATGGLICPSCRPGQPHVATLSGETLAAIRALSEPGSAWRELKMSPTDSGTIRATLGAVISHAIGRKPRLLPYLGA